MPKMTLDDLRDAIQEKYEPLTLDLGEAGEVVMQQALVLPKAKRAELQSFQGKFNELQKKSKAVKADDQDAAMAVESEMVALLQDMIRAVAKPGSPLDALFAALGDELVQYMELFRSYSKGAQLGEASASPS